MSAPTVFESIDQLRVEIFAAIDHAISIDPHHKSYEGRISVIWPDRFNDEYSIVFDCYVLGPARHYFWSDKDLSVAFAAAEKEIKSWIKEKYEWLHDE